MNFISCCWQESPCSRADLTFPVLLSPSLSLCHTQTPPHVHSHLFPGGSRLCVHDRQAHVLVWRGPLRCLHTELIDYCLQACSSSLSAPHAASRAFCWAYPIPPVSPCFCPRKSWHHYNIPLMLDIAVMCVCYLFMLSLTFTASLLFCYFLISLVLCVLMLGA